MNLLLLHLQRLVSNWLIRGELIGRQLLNNCSGWPELRGRCCGSWPPASWINCGIASTALSVGTLVERPWRFTKAAVCLTSAGRVGPAMICGLRDAELRQLSWWQAFTLLLEARDAWPRKLSC